MKNALLAIFSLLLASAAPVGTPTSLSRAMQQYERAQIMGDGAALDRLLADDYLLVSGNGGREDKHAFIRDLTDPGFRIKPYSIERPVLRVWPGGAVSAGIARQTGSEKGQHFDVCIRFADIWRRNGDRWRVEFTQVARAAPPTAIGCA